MTDRLGPEIERLFEVGAPPLTLGELGQVRTGLRPTAGRRPVLAGIAVVVLAVGVTFGISRLQPGPAEPNVVCLEPPADQLAVESGVGITLEPNPIVSGGTGNLTVMATTALYAEWQCWDGSRWVPTHYLTRGGEPVEYDEVGYIPAMGFLPGPVPVTIPQVPAGTYRIRDTTADGEEALLIVRVVEIVPPTTLPVPTTAPASVTTTTLFPTTTTTLPIEGVPFDVGPLQGRGSHSVVWTGEEMIVWGGMGSEIGRPIFADGAAFDPESNSWRVIAEAPIPGTFEHHAVWTGTEMIIISGPGRRDGAAYDPATDSWRTIADAPFPLATASDQDATEFSSSVWTGERLVIWEVRGDRVAAYSPRSDTWEVLPGVGIGAVRGALRGTGEEVVAIGIGADGAILGPLQGARLQDGDWVSLPQVETPDLRPMLSAWTGTDLTVWTEEGVARAYAPATDSWEHRKSFSLPGCEGLAPPLEMPGRGVLLFEWCGIDTFYEPSADARIPVNLWGLGHERWAVWTGREVLSWGDTCCYGTGEPFVVTAWRWTPPD